MSTAQEARRKKYEQALQNQNVQLFLNGLGQLESGNRYNIRFSGTKGGAEFDISKPGGHPNIYAKRKDGRNSSAAGRYMFNYPTWSDAASALGLTNFNDPKEQDLAAAWLLDKTGGLQPAMQGDMLTATQKASKRWEALRPGSLSNPKRRNPMSQEQFAKQLGTMPQVAFGSHTTPTSPNIGAGIEPTIQAAEPLKDTRWLGIVGQGETPTNVRDGKLTPFENTIGNFNEAIRQARAEIDQRLVPGTPESRTVNPLRRMMHDLGWKLGPAPGSATPLNFDRAMEAGASPEQWRDNMREFFGAPKTPATEYLNQIKSFQHTVPTKEETIQQALNPMDQARQNANNLMFGKPEEQGFESMKFPTGIDTAIAQSTQEQWNRGQV